VTDSYDLSPRHESPICTHLESYVTGITGTIILRTTRQRGVDTSRSQRLPPVLSAFCGEETAVAPRWVSSGGLWLSLVPPVWFTRADAFARQPSDCRILDQVHRPLEGGVIR